VGLATSLPGTLSTAWAAPVTEAPDAQRIPRRFHRVWPEGRPIPAEYEQYWLAWQRQYPDYTFTTWQILTTDRLPFAVCEILYQHGGVCVDPALMPYHYYDWAKATADVVVCGAGTGADTWPLAMAAAPLQPLFAEALCHLAKVPAVPPALVLRELLKRHSHQELAAGTFCPSSGAEERDELCAKDLSNVHGVPARNYSEWSPAEVRERAVDSLRRGALAEADLLLRALPAPGARELTEYLELVKQSRRAALAACGHAFAMSSWAIQESPCFELLKCCFALLDSAPDTVVWQIGAADGILVDPIRPLLIARDPRAVLLEPNPYLFARLRKNYARNRNTTFMNAALGREPGVMELRAINPGKLPENNLPDWALGVSSFYDDRNAIGGIQVTEEVKQRLHRAIEKIPAQMVDAPSLLAFTGAPPDIVAIDAEGMEGDIIRSLFGCGIKPRILQYEYKCLPQWEQADINTRLQEEYVQLTFRNDRIAYRTDFLLAYCSDLYVNHGIPTIFETALRGIVGEVR